jgi:hypothetical protein
MTKIFPACLIVLMAAAGVVAACAGDWRRAIYWVAAAVLNAAVTF